MRRRKPKKFKRRIWAVALTSLLIVIVISLVLGYINQEPVYGFAREVSEREQQLRLSLVEAAESWLGSNEQDDSHRAIIDLYNQHEPLAQNYLVKYDDQWCATFVSASAIKAGLTSIIPTECGCQRQIDLLKELGAWEENDDYLPLPGDIIYYCRSNLDLTNDCTAWSDHVGIVVGTSGNRIKVIEGNFGDKVDYRYLQANAMIIRGFGVPQYRKMY
jgi:hypothetical protein